AGLLFGAFLEARERLLCDEWVSDAIKPPLAPKAESQPDDEAASIAVAEVFASRGAMEQLATAERSMVLNLAELVEVADEALFGDSPPEPVDDGGVRRVPVKALKRPVAEGDRVAIGRIVPKKRAVTAPQLTPQAPPPRTAPAAPPRRGLGLRPAQDDTEVAVSDDTPHAEHFDLGERALARN